MVRVLPSPTEKNVAMKEGKRSFINIEMEVFNLEVGAKRAFFPPLSLLECLVWGKETGLDSNNRGSDAVSLSPWSVHFGWCQLLWQSLIWKLRSTPLMATSAYKANFEAALRDIWFCDWLFGVHFTIYKTHTWKCSTAKQFHVWCWIHGCWPQRPFQLLAHCFGNMTCKEYD